MRSKINMKRYFANMVAIKIIKFNVPIQIGIYGIKTNLSMITTDRKLVDSKTKSIFFSICWFTHDWSRRLSSTINNGAAMNTSRF